jgi:hypothetical protein
MGVVKRIVGWRLSSWPIASPLQVLVGLIEPRDPEAFLEAKRAVREAAKERAAIQEDSKRPRVLFSSRLGPPASGLTIDDLHVEVEFDQPVCAQPGWYRVGSTFYRIGMGPFARWEAAPQRPASATIQAMLF